MRRCFPKFRFYKTNDSTCFNYLSDNYSLALFCNKLINFIDKFGFQDNCKRNEFQEVISHSKKNDKNDYGKFQFKQDDLQVIHGYFNSDGKLWESIDLDEFCNNFKELPARTLMLKNVEGFCFLMGRYEDSKTNINNINYWFIDHFPEITNYSKQKAKKSGNAKLTENKKIQEYIINKLQLR